MSEKEKKNAFFFSFQNEGRVITASMRKNYCKARRRLRLYSFLHLYADPIPPFGPKGCLPKQEPLP